MILIVLLVPSAYCNFLTYRIVISMPTLQISHLVFICTELNILGILFLLSLFAFIYKFASSRSCSGSAPAFFALDISEQSMLISSLHSIFCSSSEGLR